MEYRNFLSDKLPMKWPYPVKYEDETWDEADVLVVGCGLAGSFAAIQAAKRGASVIAVDKAPIIYSGSAGTGIDHWTNCLTNPCSRLTPDEMVEDNPISPITAAHGTYICMREAWPCLQDFEEMGINIRDAEGEFEGASFRDPETKLMFAYDYTNKLHIRFKGGRYLKPTLYKEMKKMGVRMYEHVMMTVLLTEDGKAGGRVIGAAGFSTRTGEFFVFSAKATIMATANPVRLWQLASEQVGSNAHEYDPNLDGGGNVMAWRAGAQLMLMENSQPSSGGRRYPSYMTGNSNNTWFGCSIVDSQGKEIPWVNRDGEIIQNYDDRMRPAPGQKWWMTGGPNAPYKFRGATYITDFEQRIMSGEYQLPFFADMTGIPDCERRGIFGLMIGNEGKTAIPVYEKLKNAGFDPEKDMMMCNVLHPHYAGCLDQPFWDVKIAGINGPNMRDISFKSSGGILVDWDMRSSLEGLYAAGNQVAGLSGASQSASSGRYVGRTAAHWAQYQTHAAPCPAQIQSEKERIYSYVQRDRGYGWKEIQIGLCRIMQDYCGDYKNKDVLLMGLWWLDSIRHNELAHAMAANPHDLGKIIGCEVRLSIDEIILHQCLAREGSNKKLGFDRLDFPESDEMCGYNIAISQQDGKIKADHIPFDYCTREGSLRACYEKHCCLKEE